MSILMLDSILQFMVLEQLQVSLSYRESMLTNTVDQVLLITSGDQLKTLWLKVTQDGLFPKLPHLEELTSSEGTCIFPKMDTHLVDT